MGPTLSSGRTSAWNQIEPEDAMERYKYLCILTGVQILFLFSIQSRPHGLGRLCRLGTLKSSGSRSFPLR